MWKLVDFFALFVRENFTAEVLPASCQHHARQFMQIEFHGKSAQTILWLIRGKLLKKYNILPLQKPPSCKLEHKNLIKSDYIFFLFRSGKNLKYCWVIEVKMYYYYYRNANFNFEWPKSIDRLTVMFNESENEWASMGISVFVMLENANIKKKRP